MVVTFILLALCVSANADPAPAPPSGYNGPPPEGQCPNDWWKYAGKLCIQLDHEPGDFEEALWRCKHWEDHSAEIKEFLITNEDWSLLLTVGNLNYLKTLPKLPFNHKIWLNAFWFEEKWYEIARYHHNKNYREHIEDGDAVEILQSELDQLKFEDNQFNDGDTLVYNHWHDAVFKRWNGYNGKFSYVCTHRKEYKDLINVDVKIVDENDDDLPAFLWVEDKTGTWLASSNGEYQFPKVELGTKFHLFAGFSPKKDEIKEEAVSVVEGIAPIKIQLRSGKAKVQFKVIDETGGPVEGAMVANNGGAPVATNAAGLIPLNNDAFPCGTKFDYVVDGPATKQYKQATGIFVVPKTHDPEVTAEIPLEPVPNPVYVDVACAETGTIGNWKIYIYEKNAATDLAGCELACNGPDAAAAKACDFFIVKNDECWLGDFARAGPAIFPDAAALEQPVDIKLKQGSLEDGSPLGDGKAAYSDSKEECGLVAVMAVVTNQKDTSVASETECAARCALGCTSTCQSFKYDAASQDCNLINWANPAASPTPPTYTPYNLPELTLLQTLNNLKQLAVDAQAAIVADSADNIATCPATADGNAIIEADVTALDYQFVASKKCILTVYNPNPGKKVTLTLPVAFGGAGTGTAGTGLNMYVGTFTSGNLGVSFYSNDFSTALAAQTTIDWYAPVVTIQMVLDVANFDKIDGASITFEP